MQNFWFDDVNVFEQFRQKPDSRYNFLLFITDIGNLPKLVYHPVTITKPDIYVELPTMHIGLTTRIFFKFRTTKPSGVILFNKGRDDYIAVELHNGKLRYAFDTGGNPETIDVATPAKLNDNKWHDVWIQRISGNQHEVRVDNTTHTVSTSNRDNKFDLSGSLYIGGLPEEMFNHRLIKNVLKSKHGFVGCLASFDLNGAVPELTQHSRDSPYIHDGCKGKMNGGCGG